MLVVKGAFVRRSIIAASVRTVDSSTPRSWIASRGIKSGGFNLPLFPLAPSDFPYDGETLIAYEVGMKSDLTDKVRFNASAVNYDYQDYQAYSFVGFATVLVNAPASTTQGRLMLCA